VVQVVAVQVAGEGVGLVERDLRPEHLPEGDRPVQSGHRRGQVAYQRVVQQHDLHPVGGFPAGGLGVTGHDGGLELIGTGPPQLRGADYKVSRGRDLCVIPSGPVLVAQEHEPAFGVEPRRRAGTVQADQGEQPEDFRLRRHQPG
jgi:hypothetical protein